MFYSMMIDFFTSRIFTEKQNTMIDLKEAERIKKALDKEPENYKAIIEGTFLGICITDEKGNFRDVNGNYAKMYGYDKSELIGQSFLKVVPDEQKNNLQELHDLFMKMRDEIMRNWEVQRKDGLRIKIFADAGYSGDVAGGKSKITFVWPKDEALQKLMTS